MDNRLVQPPILRTQLGEDTYAVVRSTNSGGVLERTIVEGEANADLASGGIVRDVKRDGLISGDVGARATVYIGLVVSLSQPGAGIIVSLGNVNQLAIL